MRYIDLHEGITPELKEMALKISQKIKEFDADMLASEKRSNELVLFLETSPSESELEKYLRERFTSGEDE